MSEERKKYIKFVFKRKRTRIIAETLVELENKFDRELNNIVLPCGAEIRLASSISRYEKIRLMFEVAGFKEEIEDMQIKDHEYAARMIDAWRKLRVKS